MQTHVNYTCFIPCIWSVLYMYVYICTCMYIHRYVRMYIYVVLGQRYTCTYMHVYNYVCASAWYFTHIHVYTCTYVACCLHVHVYTCMCSTVVCPKHYIIIMCMYNSNMSLKILKHVHVVMCACTCTCMSCFSIFGYFYTLKCCTVPKERRYGIHVHVQCIKLICYTVQYAWSMYSNKKKTTVLLVSG